MEGSFKEQWFFLWGEWAFPKEWREVLREWSLETCLGDSKVPWGSLRVPLGNIFYNG
jgi:hypothetical protein